MVTPERSLVLVAGSGRSGTSLMAGILQRLGYAVPQPEIPADETNPRGFAESRWVVEFHTRLLHRSGVQVADARPRAWALTAQAGLDVIAQAQLREWLGPELELSRHVIVKDPRLSWFLPLWRRTAEELGVTPRFVTMLRHPAAVIQSKQRWYGGRQGEVARGAGWLNQTLFTERATRDGERSFVRYEDLLEDWTQVLQALDLPAVRRATPAAMRRAHEFVDRGLSRSQPDWDRLEVPRTLRELADQLWAEIAEGTADAGRLDELRAGYVELYEEAEALAHSSITAARQRPPERHRTPAPALIRRVPMRYRRRVPHALRAGVIRTLAR
jgi:hypothetical protein